MNSKRRRCGPRLFAYKLYERGAVPNDDEIESDIDTLLGVYERHVAETSPPDLPEVEPRPIHPSAPNTIQDALSDLFLQETELNELLTLWQIKKNLLLQGPPGVGKTYVAKRASASVGAPFLHCTVMPKSPVGREIVIGL